MSRMAVDRRIDIYLEADDELPPVLGDRSELEQVIMNLILNARDAILERLAEGVDEFYRPLIGVTASSLSSSGEDTAEVLLMVQDNGVGMPQDVRDRAFDPFFTTKESGRGTGLGLATAFRTVAAHGGALSLQSTPGAGTTFTILLPAWSEEAALDTGKSADADQTHTIEGRSVLIVDDEPAALETASAVLSRAGCDVVTARDGTEGLRLAQERPFDLIVLDLNMPGMSGWDVYDRLRAATPNQRVLIVSGYSADEDVRRRGAHGFLSKPYSIAQLIEAATRVLDRAPLG